jgi:cobalt/nickel transport system ATP-binding protein
MNLTGYRDYAPQYLSGGEKKRVSIADILAMHPEMILLDEPTASLDPENADTLKSILDELNNVGITIIISTHDVNFAYRFAERAIIFTHGEIIADAAIEEVFVSETVLKKAGLKKPLLYEVSECMRNKFPDVMNGRKPRTIEEFKAGFFV